VAFLVTSCKKRRNWLQSDTRLTVPFTHKQHPAFRVKMVLQQLLKAIIYFVENNSGVTTSVAVGINLRMGNPIIDDIAVGAPLNSVANGTSPAQTTNAPISKIQTSVQTTAVKVTLRG
jgi:hypothetical protein